MAQSERQFNKWKADLEKQIEKVRDERLSQLLKWGPQDHDDGKWLKILVEEVGELAQSMLELKFDEKGRSPIEQVEHEAIQIAAVALTIAQVASTRKPA